MVKVKICGITNLKDAIAARKAGAHAVGFVFYKKSPRYITPEEASRISKSLPRRILKVGVFVNAREKSIKQIAKFCNLDMLQFHGDESSEFCRRFKGIKIIKAFRIKNNFDLVRILKYETFACLFDTFVKSSPGGTGKSFNWKILSRMRGIKQIIFLSGGLTAQNVGMAIEIVRPDWVDVSSSVEIKPGKKDKKKVIKFIQKVEGLS